MRGLLAQIGWSERELAARLGCAPNTVNEWCVGKRPPPETVTDWLGKLVDQHTALPPPEWRRRG